MTALKVLLKLIILIYQNDGQRGAGCWKLGTKFEFAGEYLYINSKFGEKR
jgi:hypothetical protein